MPGTTCFICSYPKSGRTWLAWLLANYFNISARLGLDINFRTLYQLIPADGSPVEAHDARRSGLIPSVKQTHNRQAELFQDVIFLVRDPLDTLVSYYFHECRQLHKDVGSIQDFVRTQAKDWVSYMNVWTDRLPKIRSLILPYEARLLHGDTYLAEVLRFVGVAEIDSEILAIAIRQSGFSEMLSKEMTGPFNPGHQYDLQDANARRVRQGKVGGWRYYLNQEDATAIRQYVQELGTVKLHSFLDQYGYALLNGK